MLGLTGNLLANQLKSLGQARKAKAPTYWSKRSIDGDNAPFAEFIFEYCSKGESQIYRSLSRSMFKAQGLHNPTICKNRETAANVDNERGSSKSRSYSKDTIASTSR